MSWAVRIDGGGYRSVDGPFADPEDPSKLFPDYATEYYLAEADGPPPAPVPLPAEIEAAAFAALNAKQRQAAVQVGAIQSRVDALNYLIDGQDPEDPDYMEPTDAEIAELPVRKAQLKVWNTYRVKLGRVTGLAGWYQTPTWPIVPEPYTSEMSAEALQAV